MTDETDTQTKNEGDLPRGPLSLSILYEPGKQQSQLTQSRPATASEMYGLLVEAMLVIFQANERIKAERLEAEQSKSSATVLPFPRSV